MNTLKRITISLICLIIVVIPMIDINNNNFVYADNSSWETIVNQSQLSAAMKAYAMAEYNVSTTYAQIAGQDPITKAIIGWNYNMLKRAAANRQISLNDIQTSIKYKVANNGLLQFAYSGSMIQDYNALIEQYLIENGLSANTIQFDTEVYNGKILFDDEGNSCYVYEIADYNTGYLQLRNVPVSYINQWGSPLKYDSADLYNRVSNVGDYNPVSFTFNEITYTNNDANSDNAFNCILQEYTDNGITYNVLTCNQNNTYWGYMSKPLNVDPYINTNPHYSIFYYNRTNSYYLGIIWFNVYWKASAPNKFTTKLYSNAALNTYLTNQARNISINIAKDGLKNGVFQAGKNAAISVGEYGANAVENYLLDNEPEEPQVDPDVGDDEEPNYPNNPGVNIGIPIGGAVIGSGNSLNNNFDLHFEMPDLSDLTPGNQNLPSNFLINTLRTKFPFCLVYDIPAIFNMFVDNPKAPRFQGDISLPANITYHLDINLNIFDTVMVYFRAFIFILYVFSLIFITKELLF